MSSHRASSGEAPQDIYAYITEEENRFQQPITVIDGYEWSMRDHINTSTLYKNSQFTTGNFKDYNNSRDRNNGDFINYADDKPFKNIVRPIIKLQYRKQGFDVKDIELFVDSPENYYKSFLLRKWHERWARKIGLDTFIDNLVESYIDYGGVLIKDTNENVPEVVPLSSLAFCDQTDLMSGPLGIKHQVSPDQLMETSTMGWGEESNGATITLEQLVLISDNNKAPGGNTYSTDNQTPGKYIEVYEVHGTLPTRFLEAQSDEDNDDVYTSQLQVVAFYQELDGQMVGVTLFKAEEKNTPFKFLSREKIFGRALGFGGIEELFEAQVWTNYDQIQKKALLDAASKMIYKTTDTAFKQRNQISDLENGEIMVLQEGTDLSQIDTFPRNISLFNESITEWQEQAQLAGNANDAIQGVSPTSGTPFKLQELVVSEAEGEHDFKRGQIATFLDEIYRDWVIPHMAREISKGETFLAELDLEELQTVADSLITREANEKTKEEILSGRVIEPAEVENFKILAREEFMKGGNKRFIEILKNEFKGENLDVTTNIAGKQKNVSADVDKLVNVFRQIIAAPGILDDPRMAKIFNEILENSGLSPVDFFQRPRALVEAGGEQVQDTEPLQDLAKGVKASTPQL